MESENKKIPKEARKLSSLETVQEELAIPESM
jgi:hypothetical protein